MQRIDEKPYLYNITYIGDHTCSLACNVTDSSMNNQADMMTQFGVDDVDHNLCKTTQCLILLLVGVP